MQTVVFLGPGRAGKSTIGRMLAAETNRRFQSLPAVSTEYFQAAGAVPAALEEARRKGFAAWYDAIQPLLPQAMHVFIRKHEGGVLEIDGLLMALTDPSVRAEVATILRPHTTVLLLPTPNVSYALRVLRDRQRIMYNGMDLNYYFVTHPANRALAQHIVYTKDRTPEETADDVLALSVPQSPIILIGPMSTGKSTVAQRIAERTGCKRGSLDQHRWRYYAEQGFDRDEMQRIDAQKGPQGVVDYWKRFDVHAVQRFLQEHREGVLDFGAGHSVYDHPADLEKGAASLRPYPNVVLLLPSPDPEESYRILRKRNECSLKGVEMTEYLLTHSTLSDLAKIILYTEGCTPEETCMDVVEHLRCAGQFT